MNSETIERLSQFIDPHPNPREFALLNLAAIVSSSMYDLEMLVGEVERMAFAREKMNPFVLRQLATRHVTWHKGSHARSMALLIDKDFSKTLSEYDYMFLEFTRSE